MTVPVPIPAPVRRHAAEAYVRRKAELCVTVGKIVLTDAEDEEVKLRRKAHLHICFAAVIFVATFSSAFGLISLQVVAGVGIFSQCLQEYLDLAGKF
jgi:hypothetical protein